MARDPGEQLAAELSKILEEYADEVERTSAECVRKVARAGAKTLRKVSPRLSGKYAAGWTFKAEVRRLDASAVVYDGKAPGLAHLLEHGHVTRNGTGRTYPRTPAHPHIAKVEEQIARDFEKQIRISLK